MRVFLVAIVGVVFLSFLFLPAQHAEASSAMPSNLVKAIGIHESGWNQAARGYSGEIGIMQILPETAREINRQAHTKHNVSSASGNVALGTLYLRSLWNIFGGNLAKTISAYNAGEGTVRRYGVRNWGYVNHVLSLMR
jgi:soluble lytic murein transglycosylase-like protein